MDTVTQTSLEALLLKATNHHNQNIDTAAVEAFCTLVNKEKDGAHIGVKVIASRLTSGNEKELLQTLNILDTCMSRCGTHFQSEVGKFRFLNEMIKLVSPKYLGAHTPLPVKQKVLQLMYLWTLDYPKESKIKEAYDMLKKQGVIREIPNPNITIEANIPKRRNNSIFQDEEKSKILQKLLQSKDPEDIQAANWLIKSMVKEDDKRAELKSRRIFELESVQNNVRLLNEMLDSYKPGISSNDEMDLISELHQSCERLKPNVVKLATETHKNEDILDDILGITDELQQVFNKFNYLFKRKSESLLDFENGMIEEGASNCLENGNKSEIDVLCDIFNNSTIPDSNDILQPITVLQDKSESEDKDKKTKALEELDVLSEHLLRENLQSTTFNNKSQDKTPLNLLAKLSDKQTESTNSKSESFDLDLNYLINKPKDESKVENDDFLVDLSDEKMLDNQQEEAPIKLNDIFIELEKIKPSPNPPLIVLEEKNGINITIHFTKDKPGNDIYVFVITTISKNHLPISNYLFQAVVPKGCKLKLQPPSSNTLPGYNPFLPPAAITQIMLISKKNNMEISLKFIVSYNLDEETCTEMGEVDL